MNVVFVLVPVTLILVGIGVWSFFWAVSSGQFDELDAASWDVLIDESAAPPKPPIGTLPP